MKMLKLTRVYEWLGGREVWINFDLVQAVMPIKDASHPGTNARVCMPGSDGDVYDVTETCEEIATMANRFATAK